MKHYHVTTPISQKEIDAAESKAKTQDETILELFKRLDPLSLWPEAVYRYIQGTNDAWSNVPITSVRRSFSNLKKRGLIEKTNILIKGDYNAKIHLWKLVK